MQRNPAQIKRGEQLELSQHRVLKSSSFSNIELLMEMVITEAVAYFWSSGTHSGERSACFFFLNFI